MIFENFQKSLKILENPLILVQVTYPGWLAAGRSRGARGAREEAGSVRGGAPGVPEDRNMSGMLPVVSVLHVPIRWMFLTAEYQDFAIIPYPFARRPSDVGTIVPTSLVVRLVAVIPLLCVRVMW